MMKLERCPDCNNLDVPFEERVYCKTCHGSGSPNILGHIWEPEEIYGRNSWQYAIKIAYEEINKLRLELDELKKQVNSQKGEL